MGEPTGEMKPYRYGSVVSNVVVFEKRLPPPASTEGA